MAAFNFEMVEGVTDLFECSRSYCDIKSNEISYRHKAKELKRSPVCLPLHELFDFSSVVFSYLLLVACISD